MSCLTGRGFFRGEGLALCRRVLVSISKACEQFIMRTADQTYWDTSNASELSPRSSRRASVSDLTTVRGVLAALIWAAPGSPACLCRLIRHICRHC